MEKAMQISRSSNESSTKIRMALAQMATFRQATLDASTLKLYSARLARERFEDVIAALEKLQEMPRAEGETALPDIATILAMVTVMGIQRGNRERKNARPFLVGRRCSACCYSHSAFVAEDDMRGKKCPHCGTAMTEFARVRASEAVGI